mgnify:CR=1 FL=1
MQSVATMFFDEELTDSRDVVQEAINNAQEDLANAQSSTSASNKTSFNPPSPKNKCLDDSNADDPLLQSFYERDWRMKQSPPLPIKEWATMFPHLVLVNEEQICKENNCNQMQSGGYEEDVPEKSEERRRELRSKLKQRLREELLSSIR